MLDPPHHTCYTKTARKQFLITSPLITWIEDNVELPQVDAPVILFLQSRGLQQTRVFNGIQGVWPTANLSVPGKEQA